MKNDINLKIKFNSILYTLDSKKNIRRLYNAIYNTTNALFKKYDPCRIYNNECYCGRAKINNESFCCSGCRHLSSTGCTVRSLACKLHTCMGLCSKIRLPTAFETEQQRLHNLAYYLDMTHTRRGMVYSVNMSAKHVGKITGQTIE